MVSQQVSMILGPLRTWDARLERTYQERHQVYEPISRSNVYTLTSVIWFPFRSLKLTVKQKPHTSSKQLGQAVIIGRESCPKAAMQLDSGTRMVERRPHSKLNVTLPEYVDTSSKKSSGRLSRFASRPRDSRSWYVL